MENHTDWPYPKNWFEICTRTLGRGTPLLNVSRMKSKASENSVNFVCVRLWNSIHRNLDFNSSTKAVFFEKLKEVIIAKRNSAFT